DCGNINNPAPISITNKKLDINNLDGRMFNLMTSNNCRDKHVVLTVNNKRLTKAGAVKKERKGRLCITLSRNKYPLIRVPMIRMYNERST
ncbi:MAG: hypothetical protein ACRDCN_07655, partial [Tannerellaceae bacterium]